MHTPVAEGVTIAGRYRLGSPIGAGGMAEVYEAYDERLHRPVAVKVLRPELAGNRELRWRFEVEARTAARICHPRVVAIYDTGDDHGRAFIVMELVDGESLADRLARGPVNPKSLRWFARDVLAALSAAHRAGILHRDIKPGNILVSPNWRAKVTDFGIAKTIEGSNLDLSPTSVVTATGLVVGTPAYLAPERREGHAATLQSDLYAVGVVLYEALTGHLPGSLADSGTGMSLGSWHHQEPVDLPPDADPRLTQVIRRALAADPSERWPSAGAMAAALGNSARPLTAPGSEARSLPATTRGPKPLVLPAWATNTRPTIARESDTKPLVGEPGTALLPAVPASNQCLAPWSPTAAVHRGLPREPSGDASSPPGVSPEPPDDWQRQLLEDMAAVAADPKPRGRCPGDMDRTGKWSRWRASLRSPRPLVTAVASTAVLVMLVADAGLSPRPAGQQTTGPPALTTPAGPLPQAEANTAPQTTASTARQPVSTAPQSTSTASTAPQSTSTASTAGRPGSTTASVAVDRIGSWIRTVATEVTPDGSQLSRLSHLLELVAAAPAGSTTRAVRAVSAMTLANREYLRHQLTGLVYRDVTAALRAASGYNPLAGR